MKSTLTKQIIIKFREKFCYPVGSSGKIFTLKPNIDAEQWESFLTDALEKQEKEIKRLQDYIDCKDAGGDCK